MNQIPSIDTFLNSPEFKALQKAAAEGKSVSPRYLSKYKEGTSTTPEGFLPTPYEKTLYGKFFDPEMVAGKNAPQYLQGFSDGHALDFHLDYRELYSSSLPDHPARKVEALDTLCRDFPHMFSFRYFRHKGSKYKMYSSNLSTVSDLVSILGNGSRGRLDRSVPTMKMALYADGALFDVTNPEVIRTRVLPKPKALEGFNNKWAARDFTTGITPYISIMEEGTLLYAWLDGDHNLYMSSTDCIDPEEGEIAKAILFNNTSFTDRNWRHLESGYNIDFTLSLKGQDSIIPCTSTKLTVGGFIDKSRGVYSVTSYEHYRNDPNVLKDLVNLRNLRAENNLTKDVKDLKGIYWHLGNGCHAYTLTKHYHDEMILRNL